MKKLLVVAAVAMAAFASNAAAFSWASTGLRGAGTIYGSDGAVMKGATVYLLTTADIAQADLLAAARTDGFDIKTKAITSATATTSAAGQVAAVNFDYGSVGNTYDFYYAVVLDDQILISTTKSGTAPETGTRAVTWTDATASTFTKKDFGTADFAAAGWYSTVPEPTSGLLLLLGMAGLALRRRRA